MAKEYDFLDWGYSKRGLISRMPPYESIEVDKRALFKHFKKALYIRWDSDFDSADSDDYYHVIKDTSCNMESLSSNTRNMIRRCLKNCSMQIVDCQQIISRGGYEVYTSEYRRYDRKGFASLVKPEDKWADGMREAQNRGQEFWGMFYENQVVAYGVCQKIGQHIELVTWKCDYERFKQFYPSYGLLYTMINHYMSIEGVRYVSDGARTMTGHSSVQDFLIEKFNFRKAPTKLNACFRWWLYPPLKFLSIFEKYINNNQLRSLIRLYKWSR